MRGYGQLTLAQLRLFIRNRQVLFWSMFFPIFLMVMLGSFLGDQGSLKLSGTVINQDQSQSADHFAAILLDEELAVDFNKSIDLDRSLEELNNGAEQLVIVIPEGYEEQLQSETGEKANIILYYDETNMLVNQVGIPIVERVVDQVSKNLNGYEPLIQLEQKGVQALNLQYIDFLIPGIVAMMIMSNNLNGVAGQISSWRERGVLRRMQSTTLKASTFISAQITARLLLNGIQAMLVLLIGNLFFNTQVNGSWLLLLAFVVLGTLAFMSIGFIIASLAKTPESAGPIAGFVSFPLLFLGGVFFPIDNMPEFLQPIVKSLPIAQLSTALRQIMNVGADLSALWPEAVLLGVWMVVAFTIASLAFKWE